jgi:hypothetical protein
MLETQLLHVVDESFNELNAKQLQHFHRNDIRARRRFHKALIVNTKKTELNEMRRKKQNTKL